MRFSLFLTGFVASLATAAPSKKRQATAAPVFTAKTFADLSIAGGTAGDAAAEAQAALAGLPADLATVAPEDIEFLSAVNSIANDAEIAGFNAEIAASQPGEDALALGRGKTKNKVLKLTATTMRLAIEAAQGEDVAAEMAEEQTKLDKNIADDAAEAGAASADVQFDASTDNPDASEVAKDDALADQASAVLDQSKEAAGGADAGAAADGADAEAADVEGGAAADEEAAAEDANAEDANAEDANAEDANAEDANADDEAAAEDANAQDCAAAEDEAAADEENAQDGAAADEENAQDEAAAAADEEAAQAKNAQDEAAADEEANAEDEN
ncbi:small secreted protein [Diaporthe eres]|uniref:Small secreted protein n=1 Tax=Diaporthe vaccinii TaxID=105482 RepID=A0ABR4EMT9_9PEZI|nr:small secreted protein [Diaporthe eres]